MAFRWRPRPKPKPRPVKTKKPTDFNIRESGTSLGELVPIQTPSPKTTDLPVPKTGLAATPEGKESVKKILTGPEMTRRTFDTGLIQLILQAILPTPKLSLTKAPVTKAPVPVPKVKTGIAGWNTMKRDLEEIVESQIHSDSARLFDDLSMRFEDDFHGSEAAREGTDFDSYAMDRADEMVRDVVYDIMNWKVRENPKLVQDLINNWQKADKIRSHEPGSDELEIGALNYQDNIAERIQDLIGKDLMTGFNKYRNPEKYGAKWFKKTAKNLEKIPGIPPPIKMKIREEHSYMTGASKYLRVPAQEDVTYLLGNKEYTQSELREKMGIAKEDFLLPGEHPIYGKGNYRWKHDPVYMLDNQYMQGPLYETPDPKYIGTTGSEGYMDRKIIDDNFESARTRLGLNWFEDTVESSLHDEGKYYLPLRRNYLALSDVKGLGPLPKKLKKEISEGDVSIEDSRATKYITDKELKYLDDLFDKYTKGYELPEDLLVSFAHAPYQLIEPLGDTARYGEPDIFKRIPRPKDKFGKHYEVNKTDAVHPYRVPRSDVEHIIAQKEYRKVRAAADQFLQGKPGDTLLQIEPKREEVRKRLEVLGYKKEIIEDVLNDLYKTPGPKGLSVLSDDIVEKITELQTTPDPVTKGLSAISDDMVEKITEVQTTPDPITGTIDKKITELEDEAEFQARQAQEAKTVKDVKDKFLSRRQLLFPRNKNTGGLVGLY